MFIPHRMNSLHSFKCSFNDCFPSACSSRTSYHYFTLLAWLRQMDCQSGDSSGPAFLPDSPSREKSQFLSSYSINDISLGRAELDILVGILSYVDYSVHGGGWAVFVKVAGLHGWLASHMEEKHDFGQTGTASGIVLNTVDGNGNLGLQLFLTSA